MAIEHNTTIYCQLEKKKKIKLQKNSKFLLTSYQTFRKIKLQESYKNSSSESRKCTRKAVSKKMINLFCSGLNKSESIRLWTFTFSKNKFKKMAFKGISPKKKIYAKLIWMINEV